MTNTTYDPSYFEPLSVIEDRHFWFRTRRKVISNLVKQIVSDMSPGYRVLEVGCGTGNVLRALQDVCLDGIVIGMDLFSEGLIHARKHASYHLVRGDIRGLPFSKKFDLIGLFDVLEHLPDDMSVLADLNSILECDGALLLTVPAHPSLWSDFDIASHHCRRYGLNELKEKLNSNGYRVEYITYFMASIYPLVWFERQLKDLIDPRPAEDQFSDELRIVPVVNDLLTALLAQEARLIARRQRIPFGTSLLVVARKSI